MNFATVALVGVVLGQPPAAPPPSDYYPMNTRSIRIPIKYEKDRRQIRHVELFVARNGENTWSREALVDSNRDSFTYIAPDDGLYWFTMVEEDLQGRRIPADLIRTPPDLKVLVDTVKPVVKFTTARRFVEVTTERQNGEEVVVEWFIDDKNPDDANTKVHFRVSGTEGSWREVTGGSKTGVRFSPGTTAAITVRVTAVDLAGNKTEAIHVIDGEASGQISTSMSPPMPTPTPSAPAATATTPLTPPELGPVTPPPTPPAGPTTPPGAPPLSPPAANTLPSVPTASGSSGSPAPVAVWNGSSGAATAPTMETNRAQVINYLTFEMGYKVESSGPSGISRVDLWVTRDDGRTWLKWSQHDGKAETVRVSLNVPANPQIEGAYGFRVVPVSGAGLSEREPSSGDAPDLRVVVDVTPPQLDIFPPKGDSTSPDTLVIQWKAADKNFGDDPITIEWSDKASGPWQPVAASGDVVQASIGSIPQVRRLPNTGQFAWHVPAGLPPRVYLKVAARDSAGNVREVITREPMLVDLMKPKAKISGIILPAGGSARP